MPAHEWGGKMQSGACIYCGVEKAPLIATAECPKHPRHRAAPRQIPPSGLDDVDFLNTRIAELEAERRAIWAKPEETA